MKRHISELKVRDSQWAKDFKPWAMYPEKGLLGSTEAHYLYDTVKRLGPGNYANLGVFRGASTAAMAFGLKYGPHEGKVYAVDWFKHPEPYPERMINHLFFLDLDKFVEVCIGTTEEWGLKLKDKKFKFIFVDAGHEYNVVTKDIELWAPLLEEDGIIAFHDVHYHGVRNAIDNSLKNWYLLEKVCNIEGYTRHEP